MKLLKELKKVFEEGKEEGYVLEELLPFINNGIVNCQNPRLIELFDGYMQYQKTRNLYGPIRRLFWFAGEKYSCFRRYEKNSPKVL